MGVAIRPEVSEMHVVVTVGQQDVAEGIGDPGLLVIEIP
jgi:hypothetical protein